MAENRILLNRNKMILDINIQVQRYTYIARIQRSVKLNLTYGWVSDCCLTPSEQFLNYMYTMVRTSYIAMKWWWSRFL